jgi:hypothetical protein
VRIHSPFLCLALIALALTSPFVRAQDGLGRALSEAGKTRNLLSSSLGQKFVAADFDNDRRPDGAILLEGGQLAGRQVFRIRLFIASDSVRELTFESNETALTISALDVNQDGTPDLVVEQAFTHKRLQVWLNDGHGRFHPARVEDFPPFREAPWHLKCPASDACSLVLALPSRTENDHAALILQILRFSSSSSNWRTHTGNRQTQSGSLAFHSPRSPPPFLPA